METGKWPKDKNEKNRLQRKKGDFYLADGILRKVDPSVLPNALPPAVLPDHLIGAALLQFHVDPIARHLGGLLTYLKIKSRFYFPKMYTVV